MFNKTENLESQTKRADKNTTFFQKSNFKTLNYYLSPWGIGDIALGFNPR